MSVLRIPVRFCAILWVALFLPLSGWSQSTWAPGNSNWQAAGNWSGGVPNSSTDTAIFGASSVTSINRGGSLNNLGSLQFTSAAPSYTISGNQITLYGVAGVGVINNSANTQTIGVNVILAGDQQWQTNAGTLAFSQQVSLTGFDLTVSGAGNTTFNAPVYASVGDSFTKTGTGTLTLNGAGFQANATIQGGLALVNTTTTDAFQNGLTVGGGSSSAEVRLSASGRIFEHSAPHIAANGLLNLNGFNQSLATLSLTTGTVQTSGGTLTITGAGVTTNAGSSSATITGTVALSSYQTNFQVANGSAAVDLAVNATITATDGFIKSGAGTMRINQAVSTGGSDIYNDKIRLSGGTLLLGASNIIADNAPIQFDGGTLGTDGYSDTVGRVTMTANSTLDLGGGSSVFRFADSSGIPYEWAGGTVLSITNWSGSATGGGTDQVFFGTSGSGLTTGQLAQIKFINPAGFAPGVYDAQILGLGEIVPYAVVPETGALLVAALLALAAFGRRRHHRRKPLFSAQL